jgi:hypothetical protein
MSLIKWKPNVQYLTKANPNMIDRVFEVKPTNLIKTSRQPSIAYPAPMRPEIRDHIELVRVCSSRRMPYVSRYKIDRGQYIYSCSVQVDELTAHMQYDYRSHDGIEINDSQLGYETCPWCATTHFSALHCRACGSFMCYGLAYWRGNDQFIVCVGCNVEGRIIPEVNTHVGIFPKVR